MLFRCADLFTGIGGFALGLREVSRPVAYCEPDAASVAVLEKAMKEGDLPRAPIFDDVRRLGAAQLHALKPEMLTAGFPCQDVSCIRSASDAPGVTGPRSRLVFEVTRLARQVRSVKHVFLENSPCIESRGLPLVVSDLHRAGMTHVAYGVFQASSLGARHQRRRWFCLATRDPSALRAMTTSQSARALRYPWSEQREARFRKLLPKEDAARSRSVAERLRLLGNSVVPQCVALAYQTLTIAITQQKRHDTGSASSTTSSGCTNIRNVCLSTSLNTKQARISSRRPVDEEIVPASVRRALPRYDRPLVFSDGKGTVVTKKMWRTPTYSSGRQYRTMTPRSLWNLWSMIFYERDSKCAARGARGTDVADASRYCVVNPEFVEYMMGYPLAWTSVD